MDRREFLENSFVLVMGGTVLGQSLFGSSFTASSASELAGKVLSSETLFNVFQTVQDQYRPFVRWWWNGDRVDAEELVRELHLLKEAGIGGVEINPISFPGKEALAAGHKPLEWLSDEWIDMLKVVFDEAGATLLGSLNPWDYIRDSYAGWTALVLAVKSDDIGISGKGTIDCRGFEVATKLVEYVHRGIFDDELKLDRVQEVKRPEIIHFRECNNVTVKDVTLRNPASWTQQYDQCRKLLISGLKVDANAYWNNDGLDVVDCSDVVVRDCYIDSADDAYCFKSHSVDGVSESILVEDCVGRSSANGIKFGTFTRGVFKHFRFRNMTVFDTYRSAITIATVDGASVEDVVVDGLRSIHTGNPIFIRTGSRREGKVTPCLKDVVIRNLYAEVPYGKPDAGYGYEGPVEDLPRNVCASGIQGIPGIRVENVRLENIEIIYPGNANEMYAYRGHTPEELDAIPELEKSYPEYSNWKELPAWGFFIRHAEGITFKNVKLSAAAADYRPAIVLDDVCDATFSGVKANSPKLKGTIYKSQSCKNIKK